MRLRTVLPTDDSAGRLDAVDVGHAHVHQDHVGAGATDDVHGLGPIARRAHDREVGLVLEHRPQARADHRLVVHQDDADHGQAILVGSHASTRQAASLLTDSGPIASSGRSDDDVLAVLDRAESALDRAEKEALERVRERIFFDTEEWYVRDFAEPHFDQLREAVLHDRVVEVRFRDRTGSVSEDVVHPIGLVWKVGFWYVFVRRADQATYERIRLAGFRLDDGFHWDVTPRRGRTTIISADKSEHGGLQAR